MKPRVAFVSQPGSWAGPPEPQGSIEIWTHEVARRLTGQANVRVYRPGSSSRTTHDRHDDVEYVAISNLYDRLIGGFSRLIRGRKPPHLSLLHCLGYALRVSVGLVGFRPDIVHVQNQFPFVQVIRWINRRVPVVLHMHGEWLSDLDASLVEPAVALADRIVAPSEHVAERIRSAWPGRSGDCVTVHNGVDAEWLDAPVEEGSAKDILFVGRLSPEKGIHVLIEAFDRVATIDAELTLTIIGPKAVMPKGHLVDVSDDPRVRELDRFYGGAPYPELLQEMVPAHLRDRVSFRSTVPHSRLIELYRNALVLVNPSLSESFGMSVVEAMATGTPVVASDTGGMREILAGGSGGVLVEPGDVDALAETLIDLVGDPVRRESMAITGRARVAARYTWDIVAHDMGLVYADLEDGARTKPVIGGRFDRLVAKAEALHPVDMVGRTLVVAPHPDDETLGCGGTIAALTGAGHQVGVVFMTDGGLSGPSDRQLTAQERMTEARRACDLLGVKPADTWMLGLPDGGLHRHRQEAEDGLAEVFESFGPVRVLVPHEHDGHPDHEAAFEITRAVVEGRPEPVEVLEYAIWLWDHWPWTPQPLPVPPTRRSVKRSVRAWHRSVRALRRRDVAGLAWSVDISSTAWIKRGALRAYPSQLPSLAEVGRGRFLRWFRTSHELFRRTER